MTVPSHLVAALADRYQIERELGAGGMATVYLAHDVRHDRNVAVKVLRPDLATVIGPDRFLAEIKTTAHLQHPHILGLIDSGEVGGTVFYVMPYVAGESLRDRLNRELQIPVADAVRIATQVASALDYAHRHGVIHRDIKPENILLHDEQALVTDFGIALAVSRSNDDKRATETGMSLGTPQYMSPEQAMGERTLDARTDVYALGCVLYEMLTGEPPFTGPNAQAVIAKVMTADPEPVTTVRKTVPSNVAAATMMALNKLPADRFPSAAAFSAALANPQFRGPIIVGTIVPRDAMVVRRSYVLAAVAILGIVFLGVEIMRFSRGRSETPAIVARFEIPFDATTNANQIHFTPDGSQLIWSTPGAYWARRIDSLGVRRLRDAAMTQSGIRDISPDGRDVLLSGRGGLAIASLTAGPARTLSSGAGGRGGAVWGPDGYIYFGFGSSDSAQRGIARMPAAGGAIDTLATTGDDRLVDAILALPGARGLIVVLDYGNGVDSLASFDLRSKRWTMLAPGGPQVRYVNAGYLLFATQQYIMAAPFDAKRLEFSQPPAPFIEVNTGVTALAASENMLVYRVSPDPQGDVGIELRPVSGSPRTLPYVAEGIRFSGFAVSPDGRRFVTTGTPAPTSGGAAPTQQVSNLYVYELPAGPMQRFPSADRETNASWIPGSRNLAFVHYDVIRDSLNRRDSIETTTLMRRPWDGSASPDTIISRSGPAGETALLGPSSWLPGGTRAIVQIGGGQGAGRGGGRGASASPSRGGRAAGAPVQGTGGRAGGPGTPTGDLMLLTLGASSSLRPILNTEFAETNPAVSPDGRLVAYQSNSSGRAEVYVSPIDGSARRQVSLNGGTLPKWAHAGSELFFRVLGAGAGNDTLYSARIQGSADLSVGEIKVALTGASLAGGYATLPGDTLFVMRPPAADARRPFVIVMNFVQELDRLFAKK